MTTMGIDAGAPANFGNADDEGSERREAPVGRSRWRRHAGATGRDAGHREVRQGRRAARGSTDGRGRQSRGGRRGDWASGRPPVVAELGLTGSGGPWLHGAALGVGAADTGTWRGGSSTQDAAAMQALVVDGEGAGRGEGRGGSRRGAAASEKERSREMGSGRGGVEHGASSPGGARGKREGVLDEGIGRLGLD